MDVLGCDRTLEDDIEASQRFSTFCKAVSSLPVKCRRVFMLKKVYGFSHAEIAEQLNISEKTVERHISKGMARCYEYIEKQQLVQEKSAVKRKANPKTALRD